MELLVNKNTLQEAVGRTLGVVEKKTTMPILSNILLTTEEVNLKVIATDREITLISTVEAEILEKGSIAVSARNLYGIFRETREELVNLKTDAQYRLRVNAGRTVFRLNGLPPEDFPSVEDEGKTNLYSFSAEVLKKMIRKTLYAVATEEFRPGLRGVFVETEKTDDELQFKMTATDGHRLAMVYASSDEGRGMVIEKGVIVPRKGILEIRRLLDSAGETVYLGVNRSHFVIQAGNSILRCGLLEEEFPDYRRVIPKKDEGYVGIVNRQEFMAALRKVKVVTDNRFSAVTLNLESGKLLLHSNNPDVGEVSDSVEAEYSGNNFQISFNVDYLIQAVEVMEGDELILDFRGGMRPAVLRAKDRDDYITVIMPLRM